MYDITFIVDQHNSFECLELGQKKTPVETNNSPQYLAVRIASETLLPTQLYMNVNESDPRSNVHYSSSSENKA